MSSTIDMMHNLLILYTRTSPKRRLTQIFLCAWREALCSAREQPDDNSTLIFESLGHVTQAIKNHCLGLAMTRTFTTSNFVNSSREDPWYLHCLVLF